MNEGGKDHIKGERTADAVCAATNVTGEERKGSSAPPRAAKKKATSIKRKGDARRCVWGEKKTKKTKKTNTKKKIKKKTKGSGGQPNTEWDPKKPKKKNQKPRNLGPTEKTVGSVSSSIRGFLKRRGGGKGYTSLLHSARERSTKKGEKESGRLRFF